MCFECGKMYIVITDYKKELRKMTIKDLSKSVYVEGKIIIKEWDEKAETYNTLQETEEGNFDNSVLNRKIKYMYAVDSNLTIEVES